MTAKPVRNLWFFLISGIVVGLDQASKYWVLEVIDLDVLGKIELSPIFDLSFVWNKGVSFGALAAQSDIARYGLMALSGAIAIGFAVWLTQATRRFTALAQSLAIGGAIGNLIDRARFGAVADFLDFSGLYFPWVFNVADAAITVGAALLALEFLIFDRDSGGKSREKPARQDLAKPGGLG